MDALGHVNNIVFFQYCESARLAYFDAVELDRHKQNPQDGPGIVTASLNFRRQLKYPGSVTVTANVTRIGGKSFPLAYQIRDNADGEIAADGESICVWVDYERSAAMPLPAGLIDAIVALEKNEDLRPAQP